MHVACLRLVAGQAGFATSLVGVLVGGTVRPALRQMAGVVLKQLIKQRWSDASAIADSEKAVLRNRLPAGLADASRLVRGTTAVCIATIAATDYPEKWPGLMDGLFAMIRSGVAVQLDGGLRCLAIVTEEMPDAHAPKLAPILVPEMLRIVGDSAAILTAQMRQAALKVVKNLLFLLSAMKGEFREAVHGLLGTHLTALAAPVPPSHRRAS